MNLRQKIFIGMTIVGILPMVLFFYLTQKNIFDEQYYHREILAVTELQAMDEKIFYIMSEVKGDVLSLSQNPLLKHDDSEFTNYLDADPETFVLNPGNHEQKIINLFNEYRVINPNVNSVYFGTINGAFVRSHERNKNTQYDPRERVWYKLAMRNPQSVQVTEPYRSVTTNDINLGTVITVADDRGQVLGVVGMDLTLFRLSELSTEFQGYERPYNIIVNESGIVLSHPDGMYQFLDQSLLKIDLSDEEMIFVEDEGGRKAVFHYHSKLTGWDYYNVVPTKIVESYFYHELKYLGIILSFLLVIVFFISRFISRAMSARILKINNAIDLVSAGDLTVQIQDNINDEIGNISLSFNKMINQIRRNNYTMKYISTSTSLHNRVRLEELVDDLQGTDHSLVQVNIENFTLVAQIYGYELTSKLLEAISIRLNDSIGHNQSLAHASTSNFVILNKGVIDRNILDKMARDLYENLKEPYEVDGYKIFIEYKMGCLLLNDCDTDAHECLNNLNLATLNAINTERGVFNYYDEEVKKYTLQNLTIEKEIVTALDHDEFYLVFQPIINLDTDKLTGFESLLRWENNELGFIGPDQFIPLAEKNKAIVPIGMFVLEEALKFAKRYNERSGEVITISVNLSTVQLMEDNFLDDVESLLKVMDYNPEYLILEITETAFYKPDDSLIEKLNYLRRLGIRIALDDFGIGYSSINNLVILPVDYLKIDKQLLWESMENKKGEAMVKMIIDYAKEINIDVTVEGIETQAMVNRAINNGSHLGQGYLYGRPEKAEEILSKTE